MRTMGRYETIIIKPEIVHTEDVVDDLKNVWRIQQIHDENAINFLMKFQERSDGNNEMWRITLKHVNSVYKINKKVNKDANKFENSKKLQEDTVKKLRSEY